MKRDMVGSSLSTCDGSVIALSLYDDAREDFFPSILSNFSLKYFLQTFP